MLEVLRSYSYQSPYIHLRNPSESTALQYVIDLFQTLNVRAGCSRVPGVGKAAMEARSDWTTPSFSQQVAFCTCYVPPLHVWVCKSRRGEFVMSEGAFHCCWNLFKGEL